MATVELEHRKLNDAHLIQQLQILRQADNFTNLFYILRTYLFLTMILGGTIVFYYHRESWGLPWWTNVPISVMAIFLVGGGQHQLTGLGHEGSHHILFKTKKWNELASDWLCMFPVYSTTHFYRLQHLAHHQFVNDPERDPDVSQLVTSGHWLGFPATAKKFYGFLFKQLWLPNLVKFMGVRAAYNATGTDKNPYVKKITSTNKWGIRIAMIYLFSLIPILSALVWWQNLLILAVVPPALLAFISAVYLLLSAECFQKARVHPIFSARATSIMRLTYVTLIFTSLAWLQAVVDPWAPLYYFTLWLVPIFTSFSFFMILRQVVQHGNGDRGWLTNTRVFFTNPLINFCVFPMGQDFHLPHHLYATVPHYRLRKLHEVLVEYPEYQAQALEVHGYIVSPEKPKVHPTVVDVLGPEYASKEFHGVHIDNTVLDGCEVEEKQIILQAGEEEVRKGLETAAAVAAKPD
ncbi:MAG: fatty acid desaturase [Gemmataceae bacterium]|nr:fatty acid desaturase [Gemmataceae bacterium]